MTTENFENTVETVEQNPTASIEQNAEQLQEAAQEAIANVASTEVSVEVAQAEVSKAEEIKENLTETISAENGAESNEAAAEKQTKLTAYADMISYLKNIKDENSKKGFFGKMMSVSDSEIDKDIIAVKNQMNIEEDYSGTNPASIIRQTKSLRGFDLNKYNIKDKGGILSAGAHTFGGGANN